MDNDTIQQLISTIQTLGDVKAGPRDSFAIVPEGHSIASVEKIVGKFRDTPARIEASRRLTSAQSFVDYVRRYSDEWSVVLADADRKTLTALIDYHGEEPSWCSHSAVFSLRRTEEWKTWLDCDERKFTQVDFVEFIENNAPDIKSPPAAEMKQMVRELKSQRKVDFQSAVNLSNGNVSFNYTETDAAKMGKGNVEVPEEFTLRLVAHEEGSPIEIEARLRYRIGDGKLIMWYDLFRPHIVEQDAFDAALAVVTASVEPVMVLKGA